MRVCVFVLRGGSEDVRALFVRLERDCLSLSRDAERLVLARSQRRVASERGERVSASPRLLRPHLREGLRRWNLAPAIALVARDPAVAEADRGVDVESIRERLEFRVFEKRAVERDVELAGVAKLVVKSRVDGHLLRLGFRRRHKAEHGDAETDGGVVVVLESDGVSSEKHARERQQSLEIRRVGRVATHHEYSWAKTPLHFVDGAVDETPLHGGFVRRIQDHVVSLPGVFLLETVLATIVRLLRRDVRPPIAVRAWIQQPTDDGLVHRREVQAEDATPSVYDPVRSESVFLAVLARLERTIGARRPVPVAFAIPVIVFRLAFAPRRVPVHHRAFLRFAQRPPRDGWVHADPSLASPRSRPRLRQKPEGPALRAFPRLLVVSRVPLQLPDSRPREGSVAEASNQRPWRGRRRASRTPQRLRALAVAKFPHATGPPTRPRVVLAGAGGTRG